MGLEENPDAWEWISDHDPFRISRRARWSECDPAGVVYAGRFPDFLLSCAELYLRHLLRERVTGEPTLTAGIATPARALNLHFQRPIKPGEVFVLTPWVETIGGNEFTISASAVDQQGQGKFSGSLTLVTILAGGPRRAVLIPSAMRRALAAGLKVR